MTMPARSTNPDTNSLALCAHCQGTGQTPGSYYLHDLLCCEHCGGSGLATDVLPVKETLHPETARLIDDFCAELKRKAFAAQVKYGFSANWKTDDWLGDLRTQVRDHVAKGDPRDVALYSAFAWGRGWRLSDAPGTPVPAATP